jgi:hypothetical protein
MPTVPGYSGPARRGRSDVARSVLVASWYLRSGIALQAPALRVLTALGLIDAVGEAGFGMTGACSRRSG